MLFLKNQEYALAKNEFERSIEIDPFYAPAYNNLAVYLYEKKGFEIIEKKINYYLMKLIK